MPSTKCADLGRRSTVNLKPTAWFSVSKTPGAIRAAVGPCVVCGLVFPVDGGWPRHIHPQRHDALGHRKCPLLDSDPEHATPPSLKRLTWVSASAIAGCFRLNPSPSRTSTFIVSKKTIQTSDSGWSMGRHSVGTVHACSMWPSISKKLAIGSVNMQKPECVCDSLSGSGRKT